MKTLAVLVSTSASAAVGAAVADASRLSDYGTSWPVVIAAVIGAITALPEIEEKTRRAISASLVFGLSLGALGGPVAAGYLEHQQGVAHPAIPLLLALLIGHFANDVFSPLIGAAARTLAARFGRDT